MQKAVQTTLAGGASPCAGHTYERVRIMPAEDGFHEQPQIPREKNRHRRLEGSKENALQSSGPER